MSGEPARAGGAVLWSLVPASLAYPLNLRYLATIVLTTIICVVFMRLPYAGADIGYWFLSLVISRVGFDIIDRVGAGYIHHRDTPDDFPSGGMARPLKYWLVLVLLDVLVMRMARKFGYAAWFGMDMLTSLMTPAIAITLATTGRFGAAIDPREWVRVIRATRSSFALLAVLSLGTDLSRSTPCWSGSTSWVWR